MQAIDILREKGVKKSAQRLLVISILQRKGIPLTESEIKAEMGDMYDRITFYRTIQTLLEADTIHRVTIEHITTKYILNTDEHEHIHFYCEKCHAVICLHDVQQHSYPLPAGFEQHACNVLIKGICDKCANSAK